MPEATLHITVSPEETNVALKAISYCRRRERRIRCGDGGATSFIIAVVAAGAVNKDALIKIATEPNFINLMGEALWYDIARTAMERR